jgi:hypothetical protein
MTAKDFQERYPAQWNSFSDYTKQWFSTMDDERLDAACGAAKRQLNNEQEKPMPRDEAAREKRLKRLNDLTLLNNDFQKIMDTLGIKGYKEGNVWGV